VAPGLLGQPLRVLAPDGARVLARGPDEGRFEGVAVEGEALVPIGTAPGAYIIEGNPLRYALRNLLSESESDLTPRAQWAQGEASPEGPAPWDEAGLVRTDWGQRLAALLFLALLLEVWWATRRGAT